MNTIEHDFTKLAHLTRMFNKVGRIPRVMVVSLKYFAAYNVFLNEAMSLIGECVTGNEFLDFRTFNRRVPQVNVHYIAYNTINKP